MTTKKKRHKGLSSENENPPWRGSSRAAEEKVPESVVVMKKSEDSYEDFERSMLEMITENQSLTSRP
ncbi:hypothetical protein ES288_A10G055200v1 [Gossypium darwinii]|uniref:Transcription repressor n=1 Tax=Gossypium darwinii TaxID=34276 RepID=A0A5D2EYB1_GOSDA|nr:hypothetical protein ES288_A10G055200v1 [Gossypium darwinii]